MEANKSSAVPILTQASSSVNPLLTTASNPFGQSSSQTPKFLSQEQANSQNITNKWIQDQAQEAETNHGSLGFTSNIAKFSEAKDGSLAKEALPPSGDPLTPTLIDIVKRYPWTINASNRKDVPYIKLTEHKVEGGSIQKQLNFYAVGAIETLADATGAGEKRGILEVYNEIFVPKPTGFQYKFPYFTKVSYEINTTPWQQFDKIGGSMSDIGGGLGAISSTLGAVTKTAAVVSEIAKIGMKTAYPVIGVADRPRIFTSHGERNITIEFPLFNTINENDWKKNKDFIQLFMSQNLFNKRNFITGLPPVWYKVRVPGQYYSVASCVTNVTVENLGNVRTMTARGRPFIVPDAYQVKITLQEMAMPSKNQFYSAIEDRDSEDVDSKVDSSTLVGRATERVTNAIGDFVSGFTENSEEAP